MIDDPPAGDAALRDAGRDPRKHALVRASWPRLLRTAHLLCGDRDEAEDLVQATLVKVVRSWRRVQRADEPYAYARAVLANTAASRWRRRKRLAELLPDRPVPQTAPDPAAGVVLRDALWRALQDLPPRTRAVLVLRYFEDLTEAQTGHGARLQPRRRQEPGQPRSRVDDAPRRQAARCPRRRPRRADRRRRGSADLAAGRARGLGNAAAGSHRRRCDGGAPRSARPGAGTRRPGGCQRRGERRDGAVQVRRRPPDASRPVGRHAARSLRGGSVVVVTAGLPGQGRVLLARGSGPGGDTRWEWRTTIPADGPPPALGWRVPATVERGRSTGDVVGWLVGEGMTAQVEGPDGEAATDDGLGWAAVGSGEAATVITQSPQGETRLILGPEARPAGLEPPFGTFPGERL